MKWGFSMMVVWSMAACIWAQSPSETTEEHAAPVHNPFSSALPKVPEPKSEIIETVSPVPKAPKAAVNASKAPEAAVNASKAPKTESIPKASKAELDASNEDKPILLGVVFTRKDRFAVVQLAALRFIVSEGDYVEQGQVTSITEEKIYLQYGAKQVVLEVHQPE